MLVMFAFLTLCTTVYTYTQIGLCSAVHEHRSSNQLVCLSDKPSQALVPATGSQKHPSPSHDKRIALSHSEEMNLQPHGSYQKCAAAHSDQICSAVCLCGARRCGLFFHPFCSVYTHQNPRVHMSSSIPCMHSKNKAQFLSHSGALRTSMIASVHQQMAVRCCNGVHRVLVADQSINV